MAEHPFISERSTAKRLKRLVLVENQIEVSQLGGKGNVYQYTKTGVRSDLGPTVYRSGWEADFARILTTYRIKFQFEPKVFQFTKIKRGVRGYTPDFYLPDTDEWIELKGWFDNKSRTKLNRFRIYYPEEFAKLHIVMSKSKRNLEICERLGIQSVMFFDDFRKIYHTLPNWESKK